jgi:2-oxoglutarate ferredoxin oxidoreductase subunit alpha
MAHLDNQDLVLRIGGDSAKGGIVLTGETLARIAALSGLDVYTTRTIPAEIKGGHVMIQVRAAPYPLTSQGDELDMLLAYDQETFDRYYSLLKPGAVLVYNSNELKPPEDGSVVHYGLPLDQLAKSVGFARGWNIVAVGALVKLFDLDLDKAKDIIAAQLGRKGEDVLKNNLLALEAGYNYVRENFGDSSPYHLPSGPLQERLTLSGNQALAMGALAGGCTFYAGYPITPASDIMEFLANQLPKMGGTMIQAEDEMAALAMVLGASFTGARSMTATSGPGLDLMGELIGHAAMTETPCVIVDVQRCGPSTGMPTKVSQGDLMTAIYGSHDDTPRIVMAPVSIEDNFYQMVHAFNLAEKYQTPVIFLSDQDMSVRVQTIPPFDLSRVFVEQRLLHDPSHDGAGPYERYRVTEGGISPMSLPGMPGGQYTAEGLEHHPDGAPGFEPDLHQRMMEKRARKIQGALEYVERHQLWEEFGVADAPVALIGWGSTIGPVQEAAARAAENGMPVAVFYPKVLYPLPANQIARFLQNRQAVIVVEMNMSGQLADLLAARFGQTFLRLNKYRGHPFRASEIYAKIQQVYEQELERATA